MQTKFDQLPEDLKNKVLEYLNKMSKDQLLEFLTRRLTNSDILKAISSK